MSQLSQQRLDEPILLRRAERELPAFQGVLLECTVIGKAFGLSPCQTVVDEVDEVDKNVATTKDLRMTRQYVVVEAPMYVLTFRHPVMLVGISSTWTSRQSSCDISNLVVSMPYKLSNTVA